MTPTPIADHEKKIIWLLALLQFVNILDFMMVMPLGPDFARSLGIAASRIGDIGGSYTAAAAASGIAGFFFLDRFDRRPALLVCVVGLAIGTWAAALAWNLESLIAARIVAGAFGGPATALSLSVIADIIPRERRGRAMATLMATFAVASVLGVPTGLEIAHAFNWQAPFLVVGGLAALTGILLYTNLPSLRDHLATAANDPQGATGRPQLHVLLLRPEVLMCCAMAALIMFSMFAIIPSIAPFVLLNLDYPRDKLGILYMVGGVVSFTGMNIAGRLVDKFGTLPIAIFGSSLLLITIYTGIVHEPSYGPWVLFVGFMGASSFRTVSYNTLTSQVPSPGERAGFMSILSATQHISSATAAIMSARVLSEVDGKIVGMPLLGMWSIALSALVPVLFFAVNRRVHRNFIARTLEKSPEMQ